MKKYLSQLKQVNFLLKEVAVELERRFRSEKMTRQEVEAAQIENDLILEHQTKIDAKLSLFKKEATFNGNVKKD